MTASLGAELRRFREAAGLSQHAVATRLGVKRPTISQWESGKHKPSVDHLTELDDLYGAGGGLAGFREPVAKGPSHTELFDKVADALVEHLVVDKSGQALGWSHHLPDRKPTPLSTAFVLRTLQLLDRTARVDVSAIAERLMQRHSEVGWSNRPSWARPEANAVVLMAMAKLGHIKRVDEELAKLEASLDDFSRTRPYILATVLECVLALRPESAVADRLTGELLNARTEFREQGRLWTMDASADPEIAQPSVAHIARATTVLRQVRTDTHRAEVDNAVESAIAWIIETDSADDGVIEVLRFDPGGRAADVPVNHFTATWALRAMAGMDHVPNARREIALDAMWDCYTPQHGLWAWRSDGSLPSWMTYDAIAALQAHVLSMAATPIAASS